jgi:hypothetical protein
MQKPEMDKDKREEMKLIICAFPPEFIPEIVLDVALVKVKLNGTEPADSFRFSAGEGYNSCSLLYHPPGSSPCLKAQRL